MATDEMCPKHPQAKKGLCGWCVMETVTTGMPVKNDEPKRCTHGFLLGRCTLCPIMESLGYTPNGVNQKSAARREPVI